MEVWKFGKNHFIGSDNGIIININKFRDRNHPPHVHDFIEIAYMLGGESTQYIDGNKYEFHHGQLLFINFGQVHSFDVKRGTKIIDVLIDPAWISEKLINTNNAFEILSLSSFSSFSKSVNQNVSLVTFDRNERKTIESILNMMAHEQKNKGVNYEVALRSLTTLLLTHIFRKMTGTQSGFFLSPEFLQFIRENCNKQLTLSELSRMCFYNPSYFSRMFTKHYGITLTDFIQNSRFDLACKLLENPELSTDEIAVKSGFGSKSTLYKIFREKTGLTPGDYRQKIRTD